MLLFLREEAVCIVGRETTHTSPSREFVWSVKLAFYYEYRGKKNYTQLKFYLYKVEKKKKEKTKSEGIKMEKNT